MFEVFLVWIGCQMPIQLADQVLELEVNFCHLELKSYTLTQQQMQHF